MKSIEITEASLDQVSDIVYLHTHFMPRENKGIDSKEINVFFRLYYGDIIRRNDCLLLVAIHDNRVKGFTTLVSNQKEVLVSLAFRHPVLLIKSLLGNLIPMVRQLLFVFSHEVLGGKWQGDVKKFQNAIELRAIVVSPDMRNLGVGAKLLETAIASVNYRKWNSIISWVAEKNNPSRNLFEKLDFNLIEKKPERGGFVCLYERRIVNTDHYYSK